MCHRLRTCVVVSLAMGGWLALAPATAEAQRGRAMAQAAASQYLYGGYGGYGNPRYYGGYTTAYGSGLGGYSSFYPAYGYNNGGYGYGGGYPAYGYGVRRSEFGRAMAYGHQPRY